MTEMRGPHELCGAEDQGSFLVPCYGFESAEAGVACAQDGEFRYAHRIPRGDSAFAPFVTRRAWYLPRAAASGTYDWSAAELLARERSRAERPIWEKLRDRGVEKPPTAYNVALLIEGPRQFYRYVHQTTKHPKWWYRIAEGRRDCYAAWGRRDVPEFGGGARANECEVYAARSGRGALYARTLFFDNAGQLRNYETRLTCVEFTILDRDSAKDAMLRVQLVSQQHCWSMDASAPGEPYLDGLDPVWCALIERARQGFEQHCKPIPDGVEAWRKMFLEQRAKADADLRAPLNQCFAERIRDIDWQDALRMVEEPWQLAEVIRRHAGSKFDETPNCYDANYNRVHRMLTQHDCTDERRAMLQKMVSDFVEPSDGLWNYTGD